MPAATQKTETNNTSDNKDEVKVPSQKNGTDAEKNIQNDENNEEDTISMAQKIKTLMTNKKVLAAAAGAVTTIVVGVLAVKKRNAGADDAADENVTV